jgi:uncharacterized repeat protein (TIGR03803 family)
MGRRRYPNTPSVIEHTPRTAKSSSTRRPPFLLASARFSTVNGGTNGLGSVFKITPAGNVTVIYNCDETHGYNLSSGLTLGTDGNLYGAAFYGGTAGFGTIFKITPTGTPTVLYNFTGRQRRTVSCCTANPGNRRL